MCVEPKERIKRPLQQTRKVCGQPYGFDPREWDEWVASVAGYGRGDTLLVMIAYFDESGKHAQAEVITVAGLVAPAREWRKLQCRWPSAMRGIHGPYHHSDCVAGTKQFRGVAESEREDLQERLIAVLSEIQYCGFGASLVRRHWDEYAEQLRRNSRMRDPWLFVFEAAILEMMERTAKAGKTCGISFVFDRQDEFSIVAKNLYDQIIQLPEPLYGGRLESLSFSSKDRIYALQAADLFVYEVNRFARDTRFKRSEPERWQMRRLKEGCRGTINGALYTRRQLKKLLELANEVVSDSLC